MEYEDRFNSVEPNDYGDSNQNQNKNCHRDC